MVFFIWVLGYLQKHELSKRRRISPSQRMLLWGSLQGLQAARLVGEGSCVSCKGQDLPGTSYTYWVIYAYLLSES